MRESSLWQDMISGAINPSINQSINQWINQKFTVNSAEHCSHCTEKTKNRGKKRKEFSLDLNVDSGKRVPCPWCSGRKRTITKVKKHALTEMSKAASVRRTCNWCFFMAFSSSFGPQQMKNTPTIMSNIRINCNTGHRSELVSWNRRTCRINCLRCGGNRCTYSIRLGKIAFSPKICL